MGGWGGVGWKGGGKVGKKSSCQPPLELLILTSADQFLLEVSEMVRAGGVREKRKGRKDGASEIL